MASRRPWHPSRQRPQARWRAIRQRVFARAGFRCQAPGCGKAGRLECDHVRPSHKFPGDDPWAESGLQALCRGCHIQKTRLERTTPITEDQKDWATFTAK